MTLLLTIVFGLIVWIVMWATNHSGLDAAFIAAAIALAGSGLRILAGYLPGRRE
ncbi:MAG: hypothetical protein ACYCU0_01425 [Solirubrobacteraceae bacterium]